MKQYVQIKEGLEEWNDAFWKDDIYFYFRINFNFFTSQNCVGSNIYKLEKIMVSHCRNVYRTEATSTHSVKICFIVNNYNYV